ncbi:MAG: FAD-dependent oxidoreductase, partial [Pyramidobacter sp.]|nr:FAD-dependent oxidoreductase [Pyramidobacter sp.]
RGSLAGDDRIAQWKPLLDALHERGAKVFCQLHPSKIQFGRAGFDGSPFELSTADLQVLIESYAQGAVRAKKAGFDGVEIHGAHGHEVALLLSQLLNTRTDQYGGTLENCARSVAEMIRRIKELCGDFPVVLRISGEERIPGGRMIDDTVRICRIMEDAGCDAIHLSAGMPASEEWECPPAEIAQGHLAYLGKTLKAALRIPVIVVGRVVDWQTGEKMIEDGDADFIAVGRANLADGDWARSLSDDSVIIRRCIGCNQGCRTRREQTKDICRCLQNPLTGCEDEIVIPRDGMGKKVCVIGAGLAGLEAANVLSLRGADVTVFEKSDRIGGLFRYASMAPGKADYRFLIVYYEKVVASRGVTINLNSACDAVPAGYWVLVVVAVGAPAIVPPIAHGNVKTCLATDVLEAAELDGSDWVVIGDGLVGYEVADSLIARGKRVIMAGNEVRPPEAVQGIARWHFMKERFAKASLTHYGDSLISSIAPDGFTFTDKDGQQRVSGSFHYVFACGYKPDAKLAERFADANVIFAGNAQKGGDAMDAIHSAFYAALAAKLEG